MKISELIARLEEILKTNGDLPVKCPLWDGESYHKDLEAAEVWGDHPGGTDVRVVVTC